MKLNGELIKMENIYEQDERAMFSLMDEFYDNMRLDVFLRDLRDKDFCILLRDDKGIIKGFSTQKILCVTVDGREIHGVFSGDTIIHKSCWGSPELFKVSIPFFVEYGKQFGEFYWFLISKGYKTYKILPAFFNEFYPSFKEKTPPEAKRIIDAYGRLLYPEEYDITDGVIKYKSVKDRLKDGVADITGDTLKNSHVAFFARANPGYRNGDDLVCLARMSEDNLTPFSRKRLLGK